MKLLALIILASLAGGSADADTRPSQSTRASTANQTSCQVLVAEIAAKLEAKGVLNFTLDVVEKGSTQDAKIVGTCERGTKEIIYKRG